MIVLIAYHYIVLRDDRAEFSDGKSKPRQLGGGSGFSPPISLARAARVACPGNLAALKPPLHLCHLLKCLRPGSRFLIGKKYAWLLPSEAIDFQWVKGQFAAACPCFGDLCSQEITLFLWSALKKGFDCFVQFWSWFQVLQHGTYKWLPLTECLYWARRLNKGHYDTL